MPAASVDALIPHITQGQPVVAGLGSAVAFQVEVRSVCGGRRALLYKGIRYVERDIELLVEELALHGEVHIHRSGGDALGVPIPVVQAAGIEDPDRERITGIYVRIEGTVILVFVDRPVVLPVAAVNIIDADIRPQLTGKGITRPGSHGILLAAADILVRSLRSAIRLQGGDL